MGPLQTVAVAPPPAAKTGLPCLCLRADADSIMGVGHVMRCLALAQAWQDRGGDVCLITAMAIPALLERMEQERIEVVRLEAAPAGPDDAAFTRQEALKRGAAWLVLDGYHLGLAYHEQVKSESFGLMVFDDLANGDLSLADVVLNQNAYATVAMYECCRTKAVLLLGCPYALLRREFFPWRKALAPSGECKRIIVTLGGADKDNITLLVLKAVSSLLGSGLEIIVVAGAANRYLDSLRGAITGLPGVTLLVNPPNMPELMASADLAVTAAGSSCWELAFLGVPMLVLITADNQVLVLDYLRKSGVASVFGVLTESRLQEFGGELTDLVRSSDRRGGYAALAAELVDGGGARRVVEKLIDTAGIKV